MGPVSGQRARHGGDRGGARREWRSNRDGREASAAAAEPRALAFAPPGSRVPDGIDLSRLDLTGAAPAPCPRDVKPMLATLTDEPFDREGWLFEIKWDGYRAVGEVRRGDVLLYSRNMSSYNDRYAGSGARSPDAAL